jgi:hypothetical protein
VLLPPSSQALDKIHYDPATGALTWNVPMRFGAQPGDLAGYTRKDGDILIGLDGKKYLASHIAYYKGTGTWPTAAVRFYDRDKSNLALSNLYLRSAVYSDNPKAVYAREAYRKRKRKAAEVEHLRNMRAESTVPGVRYDYTQREWRLTPSYLKGRMLTRAFKNRFEAEDYMRNLEAGVAYIKAHPPHPAELNDHRIFAGGPEAVSLTEARARFCYHPELGALVLRQPPALIGLRVDYLNTNGTRVVTYNHRQYQAKQMAWFITHGQWPKRKDLVSRNGDANDIRLENLYLRSATND